MTEWAPTVAHQARVVEQDRDDAVRVVARASPAGCPAERQVNGQAAVKGMVEAIKDAGASHAEGVDDEDTARAITRAYSGVANGLAGHFKSSDFKKVILAEHSIAEDGDVEHHVLLAQKRDGSWSTLMYSDFPF